MRKRKEEARKKEIREDERNTIGSNALVVRQKAKTPRPTAFQISPDYAAIRDAPIRQRIDWLMDYAHRYSTMFQSPESFLARNLHIAQHPTSLVSLKCMDGRMNLSLATGTPPGIIQPFRNLGGRFDLGWPYFGEVLSDHVNQMVGKGRRTLVLITYHYSKGDPHRGCAGFGYDTDAARSHTFHIRRQVEAVFGDGHNAVYPLVCGFETDEDALILHGKGSEVLDLSTVSAARLDMLPAELVRLYPDMPDQMLQDFLPLLKGNIAHIAQVMQTNRVLDIEHHEWVIGIGRGFDWMYTPNMALIIGPYSPDLADPIRKAAGIIQANMKAGRIPEDGFLLLTISPYLEVGSERARAAQRGCFLSEFGAGIIRTEFPDLKEKLHMRRAVINLQSQVVDVVDRDVA